MKKKLAIIVLFFFIIIYFLSNYSFAYTDVSIKQDAYFYAQAEISIVQNYLRNANIYSINDLVNYCNTRFNVNWDISRTTYFAISTTNLSSIQLAFYDAQSTQNSTIGSVNYYGMTLDTFNPNFKKMVVFSPNDNVQDHISSAYTSTTTTFFFPSIYYFLRTDLLFSFDNTEDLKQAIMSVDNSVNENTNAVKENTETSKETENFIKSDNEVADNTINDFTNDINVDTVDSSASTNIFELFGIIDSQENEQTTEIPINFSFMNMNISFTIDRFVTGNFLYSTFGDNVGDIISNCVRLIWTYFIFIFIVKNILSLIDKIKAGEIDKINTKNVLVDVL